MSFLWYLASHQMCHTSLCNRWGPLKDPTAYQNAELWGPATVDTSTSTPAPEA